MKRLNQLLSEMGLETDFVATEVDSEEMFLVECASSGEQFRFPAFYIEQLDQLKGDQRSQQLDQIRTALAPRVQTRIEGKTLRSHILASNHSH